MAQEPYQFDEQPEITATPDQGDEYAGLDEAPAVEERRSGKSRTLMIAAVLIVLIGGAVIYFAYQFMAVSSFPDQPPITAIEKGPAPANDPSVMSPMVPQDGQVPATEIPADGAAIEGAPVAEGTTAVVDGTLPPAPVAEGAPVDAAATPDTGVVHGDDEITLQATPAPADSASAQPGVAPVADPAGVVGDESMQLVATPPPPVVAPTEVTVPDAGAPAAAATPTPPLAASGAMPAPPADQLKPINANDVMAKAAAPTTPQSATEKKTADTIAAVNEILGGDVIPSPAAKKPAQPEVVPPTEITSRAQQVIFVKKGFSASSPQAAIAAGDRVLQAKQYDSAVEIFNRELKSNPSDPSALAGKALALQKAGRDNEALDIYDRLLDLNPRDLEAMTNYLGLLQKQNPDEAMSRLNSLAEQYPDNPAVAGQIAAVFANQMDTPNALRYFMKAGALDDTNPTYPFNIAVLYDRLGNGAKASAYYKKAVNLATDYPDRGSVPLETIRERLKKLGG